jgi:hypothetical protein
VTINRSSLRSLVQWSALILLPSAAFAQSSVVRSGSLEVGPFIGASYGIDKFRVMGGGNVTYALKNRYVLPYFEVSYFPGLPHTYTNSGSVFSYSTGLTDVHAGVHIRLVDLPGLKESRFVPYLVFGVGELHASATTGTDTTPGIGTSAEKFPSGTSLAFNGGGGIRYYIGGSGAFGLRVEAKVYKATSGAFSNDTIGKVEAGFFFQIH